MKYQHGHHAGNFADVHKHVTLLALLAAITRKEKPFLFVDTHAGRGIYRQHESARRVASGPLADAQQGEANRGVERVLSAVAQRRLALPVASAAATSTSAIAPAPAELESAGPDPIDTYASLVLSLRAQLHDHTAYPGSPWLAAACMRPDDRGAAFELQAAEHAALSRALEYHPRFSSEQGDGFKRLRSLLPPPERRALVLIDPPFEEPRDEQRRVLEAVTAALRRFETGIYHLWFPLKTQRDADHWRNALRAATTRPILYGQLAIYPLDSRAGLNGSGIAIVNPPYLLEVAMANWLPELHRQLDPQAQGGNELCML